MGSCQEDPVCVAGDVLNGSRAVTATKELHGFFQDGFKMPVVNARACVPTAIAIFNSEFESAALFRLYYFSLLSKS
jgi:hypothetical protein